MPLKSVGRLFKRKDGKWMMYIPKELGDDSQFPFKEESQKVRITVNIEDRTITISE